jgi:uncharacterized FlaG/YvyC family protein
MNLDDLNQQLANLATCGDPAFASAAQQVAQLTQQAQAGQMSPQDLTEILKDMQRQLDIIQDANQIAYKEELNTIINGLITVVGAVY